MACKGTDRLQVKVWKKPCLTNSKPRKAGGYTNTRVYVFPPCIDFKGKHIIRDKERQFIMMKGLAEQEDLTMINGYAPHNRASKCRRQNLTQ